MTFDQLGIVMATTQLYQQVADHLREAILSGEYRPNEAIPTEMELCQRFNATRTTVRRAVRVLREEGWVEIRRGQGTFVRLYRIPVVRYRPTMPRGGPYTSMTTQVSRAGSIRPQGVEVIPANRRAAVWLEIPEGEEVVVRRRHLINVATGEVTQLYDSYLPFDLVKDTPLAGPKAVVGGVYVALARIDQTPVRCDEEVCARMPNPEEAALLRLGERTPVLEVLRITRNQSSRVVEALRIRAGADQCVLSYNDLPIDPGAL